MSDEKEARDRIGRALTRARDEIGIEPLADPLRATAVVADLVGHPHHADIDDIPALRSTLLGLAEHADHNTRVVEREPVVSAVSAQGIPRSSANRAFDVATDSLDLTVARPTPDFWTPARLIIAAVAAVILIGGGYALLRDGSDDEIVSTTTAPQTTAAPTTATDSGSEQVEPTTSAEVTTTSTAPEAQRNGLTATFAPISEGEFEVTRGWRVTPSQTEFVGVIVLAVPDGETTAAGIHSELAPAGPIPNSDQLEWSGAETTVEAGNAARFELISLTGDETVQIEFRAPINAEDVIVEQDVLTWFDEWAIAAQEVLNPLGEGGNLSESLIDVSVIDEG